MSRRAIERWKWACRVAAPRLTGTQRAVLHVIAAHADANTGATIVGQERMAGSAGVTDRAVRTALGELEAMGLIVGEPRPGKSTVWTVNANWTPEVHFRAPRKLTSAPTASDPGSTPEAPRKPTSDEGEGEGTTSLTPNRAEGRREGEAKVIELKNKLTASLSMDAARRATA